MIGRATRCPSPRSFSLIQSRQATWKDRALKKGIDPEEQDRLRAELEKTETKPIDKPEDKPEGKPEDKQQDTPEDKPEEKPEDKAEQQTRDDFDQVQKPLEDIEPPLKPPDHIEAERQQIEPPTDLETHFDPNKPLDILDFYKPLELAPPGKPPVPFDHQIEVEETEWLNRAFLAAEERSRQQASEAYERRLREEAEEEEQKRLERERIEWERTKGEQPEDKYGDQ